MLRSTRTLATLVHRLVCGTLPPVATVLLGAVVVSGCKDESQPEYWIDALSEPPRRAAAVKRLEQFYEDAVTKAGKNEEAPEVKALVEKIHGPLTKAYVEAYGDLDGKTRVALIKLLAGLRDARTEPALKKAFEEFAKKPTGNRDDADIKWAIRAAAALKLPGLEDSVVQAFQKLRASTMLGGITYKDFNEGMVAIAAKSWTGPLTAMLEPEMEIPQGEDAKDASKVDAFRDQQFWQTTAAEVLGQIGDAAAVDALIKVLLDPGKANAHATALVALIKIGKPANDAALKLLTAPMTDSLAIFHATRLQKATKAKEAPKDSPHVAIAALIVGTIGRAESITPMIDALEKADKDVNRAVLARELSKIPATEASKAAFRKAFEKISIETNIPPGYNALQMLAEATSGFKDPGMVPWLLERATGTKGDGESLKALQSALLETALKLAKPDQMDSVAKVVEKVGTQVEKDLLKQARELVGRCADKAACYLAEMEKTSNQEKNTQFVAIKAGYMLAAFGNESHVDELVKGLGAIDNAAVRFVAAQVIDFLLPKGSKDIADKLEAIIAKNRDSGDQNRIMGDAPLRQVMVRIRSRAG